MVAYSSAPSFPPLVIGNRETVGPYREEYDPSADQRLHSWLVSSVAPISTPSERVFQPGKATTTNKKKPLTAITGISAGPESRSAYTLLRWTDHSR